MDQKCDVLVVGGGLSGLVSAILLSRQGLRITLIEKKKYPFHRVCGEYISNEVIPFLEGNKLYPKELLPSHINEFILSAIDGKKIEMPLDLGGFGISRYQLDHWLMQQATQSGVEIHQGTTVSDIEFEDDQFAVDTHGDGQFVSRIVIAAYGKKSNLDLQLQRKFTQRRYPFIGVKYHIKTQEVGSNTIALHNFKGGYCGVSKVENETFNLCYLSTRNNLKEAGSIEMMERSILFENPHLERIWKHSDFLFNQPKVINEVTFERKEPVKDHILMAGDAAGMITPLSGNGMAMAIHSATILSDLIIDFFSTPSFKRSDLEIRYTRLWRQQFAFRHWMGRRIQQMLFGTPFSSRFAISLGSGLPPVARWLMKQTHGKPFR